MLVVSNTSPLIALAKINQFIIFKQLFQTVLIPQAVSDEFMKNCTLVEKMNFQSACQGVLIPQAESDEFMKNCTLVEKTNFQSACQDCIEIVEVQPFSQTFSRCLGVGEREALTLATQKQADILIIDDRKALNEAHEHKLTAISTRAVLKMAAEQKIITDYQTLETALKQENFFLPNY